MTPDVTPAPVSAVRPDASSNRDALEGRLSAAVDLAGRLSEELSQVRHRLEVFEVETARRLAMLDDEQAALTRKIGARGESR